MPTASVPSAPVYLANPLRLEDDHKQRAKFLWSVKVPLLAVVTGCVCAILVGVLALSISCWNATSKTDPAHLCRSLGQSLLLFEIFTGALIVVSLVI
jgi:hypothetical protein